MKIHMGDSFASLNKESTVERLVFALKSKIDLVAMKEAQPLSDNNWDQQGVLFRRLRWRGTIITLASSVV